MQPESLSPYSLSVHKYNTLSVYAAIIVNVCCTVLGLHDHFHAIKLSVFLLVTHVEYLLITMFTV